MIQVVHAISSTGTRYEILVGLGRGKHHDALARSETLAGVKRDCVLRRLPFGYEDHPELVEMFLDDARIAAQLDHPNIEAIYDLGMLGGRYFVATEYAPGESAAGLLPTPWSAPYALPVAGVLSLVAGVAAGLHHAHELTGRDGQPLGFIHGDVTPWSVLVGYDGAVKLADFGTARVDRRAIDLVSGLLRGKITHLSPEQCLGAPVDRRSDLFTLGMVLWDLLTGQRLFRRDDEYGTFRAILDDTPPLPSSVRPDLPRVLDSLVLRLLAKSPAERFQRADDVVDHLEAAAAFADISLSAAAVSQMMRDRPAPTPAPDHGPPPLDDTD